MNCIELEQEDIQLELREIQLKRRLNEIEREKMKNRSIDAAPKDDKNLEVSVLQLHYSEKVDKNIMRIADVGKDGVIFIKGKKDSVICAKKYSIKSLRWIQSNLEKWSSIQRKESNFFAGIAKKYSNRFLDGDSISRTTMEKLCYLVDSGEMDKWFDKFEGLKSKQSTLYGGL